MFHITLVLRSFLLYLLVSIAAIVSADAKEKIEIKAKHIESVDGVVRATDNVVVYYDKMVIKASQAAYYKERDLLILDGDIETIGYDGTKEHTKQMKINTRTNVVEFKELFLLSENDVWIVSDKVVKKDNRYQLGTSVVSSCDITDPIWTMRFANSQYDINSSYMEIYHAKLYMWDIPVFYSPYLGFSTNKQRSSGLLFPLLGYTEADGLLYEQPIFWAISESMDLEINPQIRTNRSVGAYGTFRFVDSDHSSGVLRVGYFKDMQSYTEKYNLPNTKHYGFEFNYESDKVFEKHLPQGFEDGLYINTTYLNDIEYLTMQKSNLRHFGRSPIQESRVNYFAEDDSYYFGLNAKYFIDTRYSDVQRDKTLQILPSVQFHKSLDHLFVENFTYSIDFKMNNYDRKEGATLQQAEFRIPLEFTTSFFDDYLNLSFAEELYYSKFYFGNGDFVQNDFQYFNNVHRIKLFTDLTKGYDTFTHVLQPSLEYLSGGSESSSPVEYSHLSPEQKELFIVGLPETQYNISLSQYLYDENMNVKFYQRLTQKYYEGREYKWADLNNEMAYHVGTLGLYNNISYSHEFNTLRFSSSVISLQESDYRFSVAHSYKKALPDEPATIEANDVTFDFAYKHNAQISFNGGLTYNIDDAASKQWRFGGQYYRDCWSLVASIRQDIRPTSSGAISENVYFLQLNFTPFGSIGTDTLNQLQR